MGMTCYMNSVLQQFFMIPSFRYNILGIENDSAVEKFEKMDKAERESKFDEYA